MLVNYKVLDIRTIKQVDAAICNPEALPVRIYTLQRRVILCEKLDSRDTVSTVQIADIAGNLYYIHTGEFVGSNDEDGLGIRCAISTYYRNIEVEERLKYLQTLVSK